MRPVWSDCVNINCRKGPNSAAAELAPPSGVVIPAVQKKDGWYISIRAGNFGSHVLQVFFGKDRLEIIT